MDKLAPRLVLNKRHISDIAGLHNHFNQGQLSIEAFF